jgi:hypothetical protein
MILNREKADVLIVRCNRLESAKSRPFTASNTLAVNGQILLDHKPFPGMTECFKIELNYGNSSVGVTVSCKICSYHNLCKGTRWFCVWPVWGAIAATMGGITYVFWSGGLF